MSSHIVSEVEDMIFEWITNHVTEDEMKRIHNGEDILNSLTHDAQTDIMETVWDLLLENIKYRSIIDRLKDHIENNCEEEEQEDEEEEEE